MSKPSFRMPQRSPEKTAEIEQWVSGGETTPKPAEEPTRRAGEKMARLTIDLPPDLHRRFKTACASKSTKMIDEVRHFIEEWTQKNA